MFLLRETSRGQVLFDFWPSGGLLGETVVVRLLDDGGWGQKGDWWQANVPDHGSLADALVRAAELPREEAEQLAQRALAEWRQRGSDQVPFRRRLRFYGGMTLATSVVPLALLALLVWLLVKVL